jgi:hypothetical protein
VQTFNFSYQPENGPLDVQNRNSSTGLRTVASNTAPYHYLSRIWNTVANASYVTGSHNVKTGINSQAGHQTGQIEPHGDVSVLIFVNNAAGIATPSTATVLNTPYTRRENLNANLGIFAQDKWTTKRLTLVAADRRSPWRRCLQLPLLPHSRIEGERLRCSDPQLVEVRVARVEDEVSFPRNHDRWHRQGGGPRRSQPSLADRRELGWRRILAPVGGQLRDGNRLDAERRPALDLDRHEIGRLQIGIGVDEALERGQRQRRRREDGAHAAWRPAAAVQARTLAVERGVTMAADPPDAQPS